MKASVDTETSVPKFGRLIGDARTARTRWHLKGRNMV
jgi:hypothetical protein